MSTITRTIESYEEIPDKIQCDVCKTLIKLPLSKHSTVSSINWSVEIDEFEHKDSGTIDICGIGCYIKGLELAFKKVASYTNCKINNHPKQLALQLYDKLKSAEDLIIERAKLEREVESLKCEISLFDTTDYFY